MKRSLEILLFFILIIQIRLSAQELSGYIEVEGRYFFNDALFSRQQRDNSSIALQPEFYYEWDNESSFVFTPFIRLDSADSERSHYDIRELNYLWVDENWECRLGISKVFWGTTEFVHLVDIINQTDFVENIDSEDKLGQPMLNVSLLQDWGIFDFFVLPYFRERTFPGKKGRLRSEIVVDVDHPRYESSDKEHHVDFALRYSHTIGDCDLGIYNFHGSNRDPIFQLENHMGDLSLIPYYEQINQTGIDFQIILDEWLWKLEAFYRVGQEDDYYACVGGFEYSIFGLADTEIDLGLIGEYAYDSRGDDALTVFQNDVMLGFRISANNAASSELLLGIIQDLDSPANSLSIEAAHRITSNWKLSVEARAFFDQTKSDYIYSFRDDDFILLKLAYYF